MKNNKIKIFITWFKKPWVYFKIHLGMTQSYKSMKTLTTIAGTLHKPKNRTSMVFPFDAVTISPGLMPVPLIMFSQAATMK